jgi:hypothetical protein
MASYALESHTEGKAGIDPSLKECGRIVRPLWKKGTMTGNRIAILLMLALLWAPSRAPAAGMPRTHILMVDKEGVAIDPEDFSKKLRNDEHGRNFDAYIDSMLLDLASYCQAQKLKSPQKPCKLLFYFHGGLNRRTDSVNRAIVLAGKIRDAGEFPIFVNWRSSLPSSWWDHVAHVHNGLWFGNKTAVLAPYFIAADEAKAIADAPKAWVAEMRHTFPRRQEAGKSALVTYEDMVSNSKSGIVVSKLVDGDKAPLLEDHRSWGERWLPRGTILLTWWSKLLGAPLVVQAGGVGAWDIMQRRTAMLFRTETEFREVPVTPAAEEHEAGAALAYFISRFQSKFLPKFCETGTYVPPSPASGAQDEHKTHEEGRASCPDRLEVTLVGHSMGTIIIDRLLRYAPYFEVKNIVFMGAATSVEDYRDTVDAYLDRHKGKGQEGTGTQMYHLVLHPLAEVTERNLFDLAPRGSLLVWIDNYFTEPPTPVGRRVGRFSNVVPELRFAAPEIKKQIHLKVFRLERKYRCWNPRKHTDFGSFPFWDEDFWNPDTPTDDTSPVQRLPRKEGETPAGCPA